MPIFQVSLLQSATPFSMHCNVKLPQLKIPEFSGAYDKWTQFHDIFNSLIHENHSLSNIQKYYYLQSALKGDASEVISALELTDTNYKVAWDLLHDRLENKKIIIKTHMKNQMKNIFDIQQMTKESAAALRSFLDIFQKNRPALANLGEPIEHWDTILIYLLSPKLAMTHKKEWETKITNVVSPRLDLFADFITERYRLLESLDNKTPQSTVYKKVHDAKSHVYLTTNNEYQRCIYCKSSHKIFQCEKFLPLPIPSRLHEVRRLRACINCLRTGHSSSNCFSTSGCRICKKGIIHYYILKTINISSKNRMIVLPIYTKLYMKLYHNSLMIMTHTVKQTRRAKYMFGHNSLNQTQLIALIVQTTILYY